MGNTTFNRNVEDTFYEELIGYCKILKLSSSVADRARDIAGEQGISLNIYCQLFGKEVEQRKMKKLNKLPGKAGFPARFDADQFDSAEVDFPSGESYSSLLKLPFCTGESMKNVVMLGGSGTGKTMLSIILGLAACREGKEVRFFRTEDLARELEEKGTVAFINSLGKTRIIILDEFGNSPYGLDGSRLLLSMMSRINGKVSVILNTTLEFARWPEVLADKTIASSFAGRVLQGSFILLFGGHDRRFDGYRTRVSS
jgi:DNA replication protein DnaC